MARRMRPENGLLAIFRDKPLRVYWVSNMASRANAVKSCVGIVMMLEVERAMVAGQGMRHLLENCEVAWISGVMQVLIGYSPLQVSDLRTYK